MDNLRQMVDDYLINRLKEKYKLIFATKQELLNYCYSLIRSASEKRINDINKFIFSGVGILLNQEFSKFVNNNFDKFKYIRGLSRNKLNQYKTIDDFKFYLIKDILSTIKHYPQIMLYKTNSSLIFLPDTSIFYNLTSSLIKEIRCK